MSFQNQELLPATQLNASSTQFVSNQPSQSGFQTSSQGLLLLPQGEVVHILPTASPQQPQFLPQLPTAALFTSVVGALLQSQNTTQHDIETPITDPVLILASKVVRIEWPSSGGTKIPMKRMHVMRKRKKTRNQRIIPALSLMAAVFSIRFQPRVQRILLILNL